MKIISYSKMTAKEREDYAKERVRQQKEDEEGSDRDRRDNNYAVFVGSKIGTGVAFFDTKEVFENTSGID